MTRILRRFAIALIGLGLAGLIWISMLAIIAAIAGVPLDLRKVSFLGAGISFAFVLGFLVCEWTKRTRRAIGPGYEDPLQGEIRDALRRMRSGAAL